ILDGDQWVEDDFVADLFCGKIKAGSGKLSNQLDVAWEVCKEELGVSPPGSGESKMIEREVEDKCVDLGGSFLSEPWLFFSPVVRGISTEEVQGLVTGIMEKKWPKMAVFAEKTALGPTKENPVCDKISIEDFVESTGKGVSFEVKVAGEGLENDMKAGNPKPVLAKDSEVKLCALDNPLKVDLASGETDVKSRSEVKLGSDLGVVFSDQSTERLSHGIAFTGPVSGKGDGTVHLGGSKEQSGHAFKVLDKNPPVASERDDIAITGQVHNNVTWAT
ncbi:hypothetical protein U1Q18_040633, partial [Sarracenia purpurea var. burkii]